MIIDQLIQAIQTTQTPLVVGIDPHVSLIPKGFVAQFDVSKYPDQRHFMVDVVREYNERVIQAVAGQVPAVKFQIAFFEQFGDLGYTILKRNMASASRLGLKVILDAKRGDIGSTARGYCNAYLHNDALDESAFLSADFLTVNPFMGFDTLDPFIEACQQHDKGLFVLLKTSNPGSSDIQDLILADGTLLHEHLAQKLNEISERIRGTNDYSCLGVVVGATYPEQAQRLRSILPNSFFLVPGLGTQAGDVKMMHHFFNSDQLGALFNVSRGIMFHEIDPDDVGGSIQRNVAVYKRQLGSTL